MGFCCWVVGVHHIFWIVTPSQIYSTLSHSGMPFDSVVSFALQKPFSLMYIFISLPVFSVSYPRNHCQNQCSEDFPLCLLPGILSFQAPTFFISICVALFPFHSTFIHFKLFKTETPEGGPMVLSHDDRPWAFGSLTLEVRRGWALFPWNASWESCICPSYRYM